MPKIYKSISQLVGKTPLVELKKFQKDYKLKARIFAKLEYFNPAGSAKDRVALKMIEDAEKRGLINKDSVIIEPTSGNTGIGLAAIAGAKGYREKAEELASEMPGAYIPGQFDNPANAKAHFETTGPEIYADMKGKVDIFVAGVGTGGTITGVGEYLKSKKPDVKIVAVEPVDSPYLSKGKAGKHKIQGIGAGFIPKVLNTDIYDEILTIEEDAAYAAGRVLAKKEGYLVGISSGAALWGAVEIAVRKENEGKNIVVLLPDTGDRYLSTEMYQI